VIGAALVSSITTAQAQKLTVWSGYPEMEPFYRHVADGMKAKYPKLEVSVEAIPRGATYYLPKPPGAADILSSFARGAAPPLAANDLLPKARPM
jgi:hypothetical protein